MVVSLLLKRGWFYFNPGNDFSVPEWIETGAIKGNVVTNYEAIVGSTDGQFSQGIFIAYNTCKNHTASQCEAYVELRENSLTYNASGSHSFIIRNSVDTPNTWDVYVDYTRYGQFSKSLFQQQTATYFQVGLEISDTANTYRSGTSMYDIWRVVPGQEGNKYTGWQPMSPSDGTPYTAYSDYNGASGIFQYPVDNGAVVAGDHVSASNNVIFYHN